MKNKFIVIIVGAFFVATNIFAIHNIDATYKKYEKMFKGVRCPADLILTQNLKAPSADEGYVRNGQYHGYTKGVVTEAHILQKHLNRLGFAAGKVDGIIGPNTKAAIMRMQKYLGTRPDGYIGAETRKLLNNSCAKEVVEVVKPAMGDIIETLRAAKIEESKIKLIQQILAVILGNKNIGIDKKYYEKDKIYPKKKDYKNYDDANEYATELELSVEKTDKYVSLNWGVEKGKTPKGFKVVYSQSPNPVYPGNTYIYLGNKDARVAKWSLDRFESGKTYHFRVCVYHGGGVCGAYSNDVSLTF